MLELKKLEVKKDILAHADGVEHDDSEHLVEDHIESFTIETDDIFDSLHEADSRKNELNRDLSRAAGADVHTLPLTEALRAAAVGDGFALFQPPMRYARTQTPLTDQYAEAARQAPGKFVDLGAFPHEPAGEFGREAQDYVLARGQATGVEHLVAIDGAGNVIAHGHGTKTFVGAAPAMRRRGAP